MLIIIEILSVLMVLLYMYFMSAKKAVGWIFGVLASAFSVYLFYQKSLIGSSVLNIIYGIQGIIGYINWKKNLSDKEPSYRLAWPYHLMWILICIIASVLIYRSLIALDYPDFVYLDILLATGCILATFLEIRKDTSCWWYWITLNIAFAGLYLWQSLIEHQPLYLYTLLMLALAVFSCVALKQWTRGKRSGFPEISL